MQAIDILRHQQYDTPALLERGKCPMSVIRSSAPEAPPAHQAARPIPFASRFVVHEGAKLHRLSTLPAALGIPVIWNTRVGAATGAGQNEQPGVPLDEVPQSIAFHRISIEHPSSPIAGRIGNAVWATGSG